MKIEFEIPDFVDPAAAIRVFAGSNLIAYKYPWTKLMVKTAPCSMCGDCCEAVGCEHLGQDGNKRPCKLVSTGQIPFICAIGIPYLKPDKYPRCTVKFEER